MKLRFIASLLAIAMIVGVFTESYATGENTIPYTNTFENYDAGYPIINATGWGVYWNELAALVNKVASNGIPVSPYVPSATHSNALSVIGGSVSNSFVKDNTINYLYIDVVGQFQQSELSIQWESDTQVVARINSDGNLVFTHTWWDSTYGEYSGYRQDWLSTNNTVTIGSNDWTRLTFIVTYQDDNQYFVPYYQIQINGGTMYTNGYGYVAPSKDNLDPDGGSWFMAKGCPNPNMIKGIPETIWISQFNVIGNAFIDSFVIVTNTP